MYNYSQYLFNIVVGKYFHISLIFTATDRYAYQGLVCIGVRIQRPSLFFRHLWFSTLALYYTLLGRLNKY